MADNNFYCQFCDRTLHTKNEFDQHCNGKKHKSNRQAAQEHDAANRSLFIHGHEGINNSADVLQAYFKNFGKVEKITFGGKNGCGYAVVEFGEAESVSRALKVRHRIGTLALSVKKYQIRSSPYQLNKVIQQELEQNEKTKQARAKDDMMSMLLSASSVTEQINLLAQSLKLDVSDQKARVLICAQLIKLFTPHYGHCNIYQFGSSINGFGAKGCDLDLFLDLSDQISTNTASKSKVKKLGQIISSSPHFNNSLIIPSHRCPVVKFSHKATEIKCDLSINNRKALHNSYLLRLYSSEPRVHNLVSIVRIWAKSLELAGSSGGAHLFTSYSITLIVLFFFMRREPKIVPLVCDIEKCVPGTRREMVDEWECISVPENARLPPSDNKETDLELVKEFFTFYSSSVDWDRDAFVTRNATIFPRSSISLDPDYIGCKAACMTLLDPFVLTHNVVGNVNAKTKERFVSELKRAAQLVNSWSEASPSSSSSAWGIAALLTPASPTELGCSPGNKPGQKAKKVLASGQDAATRDSPTKSNVTPVEGEQENGDFCITVQPLAQTMLRTELLSAAKCNNVTPMEQWCIMAQELIVKVLQTVFMVEVEEDVTGPNEEVAGTKEGVVGSKEGVVELKEEVAQPKGDVALPKEEVVEPKEGVALPKEEVARPKEEVARPKEEVARPKEEVALSKEEVALPKEEACLNVTGQPASEQLGEVGSKDSISIPMEDNCDIVVKDSASLSDSSRSSESECDVHAGSYGKRTSDAAHLDVNIAELVSATSSHSDSQPKDTISNPKKRFCEGVTGKTAQVHDQVIGTHLGNDSSIIRKNVEEKDNSAHILDDRRTSVDDKFSSTFYKDSRGVIPNSCALNKTLPSERASGNLSPAKNLPQGHIDTTINPGALSEIKTSKIASYFCRCQKQLWISRKKTAAELPKKSSLTALELEQEISNHVLRKQSDLMLYQEMSRVQVNSAEVGHPLARNEDDKQLMMKAVNGQNKDIPPAGQSCVNKTQEIEFSCQILHQNVNSDLHLPHIVVKLRPTESSSNQFKNFYCSFRTLILNLIMKHFLEVYK